MARAFFLPLLLLFFSFPTPFPQQQIRSFALFVNPAMAGDEGEGLDFVKTCTPLEKMEIRGRSLDPLLKEGAFVSLYPLSCRPACRGDFLVFVTGAHRAAPVIKQIAAQAGDVFEITEDGSILVNKIKAKGPDGAPYHFSPRAHKMLDFYQGKIPPRTYLVLGQAGSLDSSRVGLVDERDVRGIVFQNQNPHSLRTDP